ncbi:MAG: hypothetical protein N2482_03640 [Patescibacteria group bacterium]|nr:hypothetical protein [Patescibacteria group bacterium]
MIYLFLIFLLEIILFFNNYLPGTFLIGWDNLIPELNLSLNFKRSLFSVWQEYRGLGLLDGMSHASNLFHTLYIALFSVFLPTNLLRWIFIFSTHLLGGIGFYYLGKKLFQDKKSAFLGALFYMFNLGVIQIYSAPLEVFTTHFLTLPFLTLAVFNFLELPSKKNSLILFLISLLNTPQSFVPPVFIVFFIIFFSILIFDFLKNKNFQKIFIAFLIVISTNLFWLLPFLYSAKHNSKIIQNSRINQYSSERIYLKNKSYGDIKNILTFKGFMMNTIEFFPKENENKSIMTIWKSYSEKNLFFFGYFLIFIISSIGIIKTVKDSNFKIFPFLTTFFISFFFLANNTPVFEQLNNVFRSIFSTLGEAFRFPFTKFITVFAFCYAILFSLGISIVFKKIEKLRNLLFIFILAIIGYLSFPSFQGYFISPLMKQKIPQEYFKIIDFFRNNNENKRIAFLPTPSFWNWEYRKWGQVGSGFLWYGIPQPILLRAFDPWSYYNEQFYNEIAYAQKQEDINLFNLILKKYNIEYLLLDTSIINNLTPKPINYEKIIKFLDENNSLTKIKKEGYLIIYSVKNQKEGDNFLSFIKDGVKVAKNTNFYYLDQTFLEKGDYLINKKNPDRIEFFSGLFSEKKLEDQNFKVTVEKDFIIFEPKENPLVNLEFKNKQIYQLIVPNILTSYLIPAKITNQNNQLILQILNPLIIIDNKPYQYEEIILPVKTKLKEIKKFHLTETGQFFSPEDSFYLLKDYPNTLEITDSKGNNELTEINLKNLPYQPKKIPLSINRQSQIKVLIPKIKSIFTYENLIKQKKYLIIGDKRNIKEDENEIMIKTNNKIEVVFNLENLPHQNGYLIFIKNNWKKGLPLDFYVDNYYQKRADLETKLVKKENYSQYIILPPIEKFYSGYSFHIVANPLKGFSIENDVKELSVYPMPYEFLIQIALEKPILKNKEKINLNFSTKKLNYFIYQITFPQSNINQYHNLTLYLSQSYHPGWKAYEINCQNSSLKCQIYKFFPFIFGKEIKEHVMINNWANGWKISSNNKHLTSNIIIVFWPQYLQFLGFGLLILGLMYIILFYKNKTM